MPTSSTIKQSRVSATTTATPAPESSSTSSSRNNRRIYWPNSQAEITKIQIRRSNQSHNNNNNNNNNNNKYSSSNNSTSSSSTKIAIKPELAKFTCAGGSKQISKKQPAATSNKQSIVAAKYNKISHISPPTSLTSTSVALRNSIMVGGGGGGSGSNELQSKQGPLGNSRILPPVEGRQQVDFERTRERGAAGEMGHQKLQPVSLLGPTGDLVGQFSGAAGSGTGNSASDEQFSSHNKTKGNNQISQFAFLAGKSFLVSENSQFNQPDHLNSLPPKSNKQQQQQHKSQSQGSLLSQAQSGTSCFGNNSGSTLHILAGSQASAAPNRQQQQRHLHIGRRMDLKYVKSLIIILMAVDLLITVFVHQFAANDELNLTTAWLRSFKLRFSFINLVLSSIWFIILIGGILFDIYWILFVSVLVDVLSFLLLLGLSLVHFTRRLDYNAIQLTSLLALLFSIIVLHVYLIVMAALTLYLMLVVRRRQRSRPPNQPD